MNLLEKIIETLIVITVIGIVGWIIKNYIKSSLTKNNEQLIEINKSIKDIINKIADIRVEMASTYLKITDFKDFKKENIDAHKELREEIRAVELSQKNL